METTQRKLRSQLTVKRPNGQIEIVDTTEKLRIITDAVFNQVKAATAKAGRGEVLSYENIFEDVKIEAPQTEEDMAAEEAFYAATESDTVNKMSRMGE